MAIGLTPSRKPYVIPSYSLTGDLLAYLKCGLQYRYHNKGGLPPSKPVQLWFGEFIHAVMEETYLRWSTDLLPKVFSWDWQQHIRPVELEIDRRLRARQLFPPFNLFCPFDGQQRRCLCSNAAQQQHKLLASQRTDAAINTWAPHLFPLIAEAEVTLQGIRPMPLTARRRSDYYEITGTADVIGSVQLTQAPQQNLILRYLHEHEGVRANLASTALDYEIILDYKGTRRPASNSPIWQHYSWQVSTYASLRAQDTRAAPVVAGILLFINELEPSQQDLEELQDEVTNSSTDVLPVGTDLTAVRNWRKGRPVPTLTKTFRERRSILVVPVDATVVAAALSQFDDVVHDIESSVLEEMSGRAVVPTWERRPSGSSYIAPEKRTCTICDFRHFCPLAPIVGEGGPPVAP